MNELVIVLLSLGIFFLIARVISHETICFVEVAQFRGEE